MPKINKEEYEVLKEHYDMGGEWIARDADGLLYYHKERPIKLEHSSDNVWDSHSFPMDTIGDGKKLFRFVKWTDSEPYNIAELVEEYESEETEVKKDLDWLVQRIHSEREQLSQSFAEGKETDDESAFNDGKDKALSSVLRLINQLDEPEVLSREFINEKAVEVYADTADAEVHAVFRMRDLQNLLVPKQELPVIPKFVAEHITKWRKSNVSLSYALSTLRDELTLFRGSDEEVKFWLYDPIDGFDNQELYARAWLDGYEVEEEQKYVVKIPTNENNDIPYAIVADSGDIWTDALPSKYKLTEEEIRGLTKGDVLFEHFAVKVEELEG